ncbi:MAG: UDP-2,3-diacylglucosamine diphosphatase LpxI [Candidatus Omnitrophica bacterium]|nr:UDP-2,3-diacylglucosamine diphosphatase LpxI [Candidatus Omnitrophota bacterium]
MNKARIGLIAGNRRFPLLVAEQAKKKDYEVVVIALKGEASRLICRIADKVYWLGLGDFNQIYKIFKEEGVGDIILAGQISPYRLFKKEVRDNPDLKEILDSLYDKRADSIFGAIAQRLEQGGLHLLDSTLFLEDFLPKKSTLTKKTPNFNQWEDVNWGFSMAKKIASLDIGQSAAIKDKSVVAVEALEGTDNLIRRGARIAGQGVIIVKVSKPKQDMRFDVPVFGLHTIKNLINCKAAGIAVEAQKTLFIDQEEAVKLADKKGIFIVAV